MCVHLLVAQNPLLKQWDYRFGGNHKDFMNSFQQTTDGGYILGGHSDSPVSGEKTQDSQGGYDFWIVKTDSLGNVQWDKDFGGADDDFLYSLQQTADGGYILGGASASGISGDKTEPNWDTTHITLDYWVVKIDSLGMKQWDKDFGGTANDFIFSLQQTQDGGYLLGGSSFSDSGGNKTENSWGVYDYWIVKIDSLGVKQWDKDLGGTDDDQLTTVVQTTDGAYIVAGESASGISGDKTQASKGQIDYWILKLDSLGVTQWDKDYGGSENDILYSMSYSAGDGFIFAGTSASGISGDKTQPNWDTTLSTYDYWVVKTDSLGLIEWDKDFGGTGIESQLGNICQTADGGYLVAGTSYSNMSGDKTEDNLGSEQNWIIKTDSLGIKQWDKTIFTPAGDESGFAIQTNDGCYVIANYTFSDTGGYITQQGRGFEDFWMVKFCDTTLTTTSPTLSALGGQGVVLAPNPFTDELTITFQKQNVQFLSCKVYNVLGKTVFTMEENIRSSLFTKKINLHDLTNGIYFLDVNTDGERKVKKIIKE